VTFEKRRRGPSMDECGASCEETYDGDCSVDRGQQRLNLAKLLVWSSQPYLGHSEPSLAGTRNHLTVRNRLNREDAV